MKTCQVSASLGSLTGSSENKGRILTTTVRVGDYHLDNNHISENGFDVSAMGVNHQILIPVSNEPLAIKQKIWQVTDKAYKDAVTGYSYIKNNCKSCSESETDDFSREEIQVYYDAEMENTVVDIQRWESDLTECSEIFLKDSSVVQGELRMDYIVERKYFVSSEGSRIIQNKKYAMLSVYGSIRTETNEFAPLYKTYHAFSPEDLPDKEFVRKEILDMIDKLKRLQKAPTAEAYTGPAILSPRASGVFFHEIFGHRVEGQRMKSSLDGQTFTDKVGKRILPKTMDVIFDPTLENYREQDLFGSYLYDDQGVKSQNVSIVEKGILKGFLMSRVPIKGFHQSNGHGRAQAGMAVAGRQSNLIVKTNDPYSMKDLRKELIKECKKQNKEYGYYFREVFGGFTMTYRFAPNVFNVTPTEVYRIYVDGRPDELVRGVALIGTPLTMFSEIMASGDKPEVFTGMCGAESGTVPVTAISPALLVKKIETQKQLQRIYEPPILKRPDLEKTQK
jgi:TldD protein